MLVSRDSSALLGEHISIFRVDTLVRLLRNQQIYAAPHADAFREKLSLEMMNSYFRWNHIRILVNFMVHRGSTCYVWALIRIIKPLAGVSPNVFNRQNNLNISRITTANGRFMNRDFHSFTSCKLQSLHDTTSIFYVDAKKTKIILSLFAKNVMSNRSLGYIYRMILVEIVYVKDTITCARISDITL